MSYNIRAIIAVERPPLIAVFLVLVWRRSAGVVEVIARADGGHVWHAAMMSAVRVMHKQRVKKRKVRWNDLFLQ
jgi:hypothetical protein